MTGNPGRTIIVPKAHPNSYSKTFWHLDRVDGICYTRGATVDMTQEFREAEERVEQSRWDYLAGIDE
jgi:hypothetical protein